LFDFTLFGHEVEGYLVLLYEREDWRYTGRLLLRLPACAPIPPPVSASTLLECKALPLGGVAIRNTDEAERNPMLTASAAAAREHFETLQPELARV
jgi:hypothetical protein